MNKEEWEKFWKCLLKDAEKLDIDFLIDYWLLDQKEGFENEKRKKEGKR